MYPNTCIHTYIYMCVCIHIYECIHKHMYFIRYCLKTPDVHRRAISQKK